MSLDGLRVLAFESRRAKEIAELIRRQQGEPFVAPSVREAQVESSDEIFEFGDRLSAGDFDMMICLTGVGTRRLAKVLEGRVDFVAELRKITVVARGPKPSQVLRELQVQVTVQVPEPNTWRELLVAIQDRPERRVALQQYGRPALELIAGLKSQGREVTAVDIYQYDLPEDLEPLREAARRLARREVDVALFTTAIQVVHLIHIAREQNTEEAMLRGLRAAFVASIGPTTSEALEEAGITPAFTPSHPKMGLLVNEAASLQIPRLGVA